MNRIIAIYILLVLIQSALQAQTEKMLNPGDLKQQTIITEPLSLRKGFVRVGLTYGYSVMDKYFTGSGKKDYLPESMWGTKTGTTLWGQYGITDRVMVEIGIPYSSDMINYHSRLEAPGYDTVLLSNSSVTGKGLGDITLSGTYQIIPSADNRFDMKASLDLTIPTGEKNPTNIDEESGDYDEPTGNGAFVLTPRITARFVSYPFSYSAFIYMNYNFRGSKILTPMDQSESGFKDGNLISVGGTFNFHLNEWIALANELNYSHWGKREVENVPPEDFAPSWAFSYETRLVFQIKRFRLGEAVNIPLKGLSVGADPTYVLLAQYVF